MGIPRTLLELWLLANLSAITWATVTVRGISCAFSKDLTANGNCHLLTAKSGTTYVSGGLTFVYPTDDVWVHLKFLRKVKQKLEIFGVTFTENLCHNSNAQNPNYFIKRLFLMGIKQIKNLNCPLLGNVTLSRYRFVLSMAQGFMPPADYLLNFYMVRAKQHSHILNGNISFSVTALV